MSAEDHLSGQFEIVNPHRLIRLGDRTYPAVRTMHEGPDKDDPSEALAAWIPMENGALTRVAHFTDDPDKYHIVHSHHGDQAGQIYVSSGMNREEVYGVEALHERLDAASQRTVSPEEIEHNKGRMAFHRARASNG